MKKKGLTPKSLQVILIVCIVIAVLIGAVGFYFAKQFLSAYAVQVSHAIGDSTASANNVQTLQTIKKELAQEQTTETKASDIVVDRTAYQSQVITDLDNYANLTDVSLQDFTFAAPTATGATSAPVAGGPTLPTETVVVTVGSPVNYTNLLKFIRAVENNLPKMIISSISISRSTTGSASQVDTETLSIAVFTR